MKSLRERLLDYGYVLPALFFIGIFVYYPLFANLRFSFEQFTLGAATKDFVGGDNYARLLGDPIIATAFKNNVLYAVISVILQVGFSHVLAAIIMSVLSRRMASIVRSFFFVPVLLSVTVIGILFTFIYDSGQGLLNGALGAIGLEHLAKPWLGTSSTAIFAVISVSQWQSIGYTMLLFIVAMQSIPQEMYEAASLDGAGLVKQYFHVTVPQTREMFFVVSVLTVSGAFTVFSEPYILTGGGPGYSSQTLATYMYRQGFFQNQMGYAAAIATLIFVITLVLSVIQVLAFRTGREK